MKPPALGKLAATGAVLGPACDAIHNQSLLKYDVLPIGDGIAKTSLLIPPLLALTYALLGGVFPAIARRVAPGAVAAPPASASRAPRQNRSLELLEELLAAQRGQFWTC